MNNVEKEFRMLVMLGFIVIITLIIGYYNSKGIKESGIIYMETQAQNLTDKMKNFYERLG